MLNRLMCTILMTCLATSAFAEGTQELSAGQMNTGAIGKANVDIDWLCGQIDEVSKESPQYGGKPLIPQCENPQWNPDPGLQSMCKMWRWAKDSQGQKFCEARKLAKDAAKKLKGAAKIDMVAAGLCLAEGFAPISFPIPPPGTCGYASIGAGAWEALRVIQLGGKCEAGKYKITDDRQVQERSCGVAKNLMVGVGPLAMGVAWGMQYFGAGGTCPQKVDARLKKNLGVTDFSKKFMTGVTCGVGPDGRPMSVADRDACVKAGMDADKDCVKGDKKSVAKKIGFLFVGLAALRKVNLAAANSTIKKAEEALLDFAGGGKSNAGGALTNSAGSGLTRYNAGTFQGSDANTAAVTAANLPDEMPESAFFKNSKLGKDAEDLANKMGLGNDAKFDQAMNSNGIAGMVNAAASAAGGHPAPVDQILAAANMAKPYIADVDTSGSAYASAGGKGSAPASGSSPSLNLAGLLGDAPAGGNTAGVTEDAFRKPAKAASIYHEDTALNLFQIVSGKIESIQGSDRLPIKAAY